MALIPGVEDTKTNMDIPSTPPNTTNDLSNQPASTRRESSRLHTPIPRPGFVPTLTSSQRSCPTTKSQAQRST
ncbi:hypothetical protein MJO29_013635 [Puccinia striiformis f. sp. tritici]|nr:hypothetical protein MJO29_013635 [Puccinia striiformis f. sp. tritici]